MAMLNNQMVYFGKTMILLLFSGTRPKNLELKARPLSNFELSDPIRTLLAQFDSIPNMWSTRPSVMTKAYELPPRSKTLLPQNGISLCIPF